MKRRRNPHAVSLGLRCLRWWALQLFSVAEPPRNPTQSVKLDATVISLSWILSGEGDPTYVEANCVVADMSMVR